MKRFFHLAGLLLVLTAALFPQASWQGDVKRTYPVDLPKYKGKVLILMQMAAHKGQAPIEGYTTFYPMADAKPAFVFYRDYLMKLGFKQVAGPPAVDGQERIDLYWPEKRWTGVVLYTPYPKENKVSFAISFSAK